MRVAGSGFIASWRAAAFPGHRASRGNDGRGGLGRPPRRSCGTASRCAVVSGLTVLCAAALGTAVLCAARTLPAAAPADRAARPETRKIVFIAGPASHGYGTHEHTAGFALLARMLRENVPGVETAIHRGWPTDVAAFAGAHAIVVNCDGGDRHLLLPHMKQVDALMQKGVGLALMHYAVVVPTGEAGDAVKRWIGGYFETGWSVNPTWTAEVKALPAHPVTRGVRPFAIRDEWYYHMRFTDGMTGVTPLLTAVPPDATRQGKDGPFSGNPHVRARMGQPEHVAWAYERPGGGRGFGFTGLHWHWNLAHDDFRRLLMNALVWVAGGDVPAGGVPSERPTMETLTADIDEKPPKNWNGNAVREMIEGFGRRPSDE